MSDLDKLQRALAAPNGLDGFPRWWLAPDGELRPCPEHDYDAREILRGLRLIPAPGRRIYDQMFDHGWVRVIGEKFRISYETSRARSSEANQAQLRRLKALAVQCGVGLYNSTLNRSIDLKTMELLKISDHRQIPPRVIMHIPHASRLIPTDARASILLSDDDLDHELLRMTDSFTDELFRVDPALAMPILFPFSRLVVDVERFADDSQEVMAVKGMGCVYTRTSENKLMRQEGMTQERVRLIAEHYHPHHQKLTNTVQNALDDFGSCLIIDCHSFSSSPLRHEIDKNPGRPDICIGTDAFHTPATLAAHAVDLFEQAGFRTLLNSPFAGAIVPLRFYRTDARVHSIMIEVNRGLYLNEATGEKIPPFDSLKARINAVVSKLINEPTTSSD